MAPREDAAREHEREVRPDELQALGDRQRGRLELVRRSAQDADGDLVAVGERPLDALRERRDGRTAATCLIDLVNQILRARTP